MRVLMLTTSYPKWVGETTAPFIEEIAATLVKRGHTVHVVAPWHPDVQRAPMERGVSLHFFRYAPHTTLNIWGYAQSLHGDTMLKPQTLGVMPFALTQSVRMLMRVLRLVPSTQAGTGECVPSTQAGTGTGFDIIHAHWAVPNGLPGAFVAKNHRIPLVVSMHGSDVYIAERYWMTAIASAIAFGAANAVTACSTDLFMRGLRLGACPEKSYVIPYGINVEEFRPNPAARTQVRTELNLPDDAPMVLGLGRLVYKKGFDVLLNSWPYVLYAHPRALLVIAGYGDLRDALQEQAINLGIAAQVCFPGQLDRSRVADYIAATDVFALPIVRHGADGLPNVLLEAMGAGRPVVASRVAGVPDVIDDGTHGLIVPERDPQELAHAINRLLDDGELAARLGAAARRRIEQELTWDQTAARFEHVYEQAKG